MSTLEKLISETNKQLLWEVLIDELKISNISEQTLSNIRIVFDKNISLFRNRSNPSDQLIHLNKQFLKIMIIAVNKLFPNLNQERRIKKINIIDEPIILNNNTNLDTNNNLLYKAEDIQQSRQTQLEKMYIQKKEDFEQYTNSSKPQELDFSDHIKETKITSMDNLLADVLAQRDADLQTIDNTYFNSHNENLNNKNWLQSEDTSIKIKQTNIENNTDNTNNNTDNTNNNHNKRLKYLNIDDLNNVSLTISDNIYNTNTNNKKKVSWVNDNNNTIDIFSKLKKVEQNLEKEKEEELKYMQNKQTTYETQVSIPLSSINNVNNLSNSNSTIDNNIDIINLNQNNTISSVTNNIPILSNSQIVKQLNELNSKLDKLFILVEKLLEDKSNNII
jgi:hypothetical protein